ncbi:MAG: efflux transporter outer membrane subunit [Burkholderiales bacterium]|nr:efflux transporter outer membrane subunit [Burkholderiales bacterium]
MVDPALRTALAAALAAVVAAACTSMAEHERPELDLPAAEAKAPATLDRWWTLFGDEQLTALVEEALARNLDLRAAVARIDEARANLRIAQSSLYPSVDLTYDASRSKSSTATPFPMGPPYAATTHSVALAAAYEVDLWGRLRSGSDAAGQTLAATRYDAETVRIALAAEVATSYFTLHLADAELALSLSTLATRDDNVRLQRARHGAGLVSTFELRQAEAERASVAATVPPLSQAVDLAQAALAVLAGRAPREVYAPAIARGPALETRASVPEVPPGLPSDLLARRPDIQRAEADLASSEFRIAEARAQYFPAVVLTGSLGSESARLADLFTGPAAIWSIAGSLVQPIIAAGRITAQVDAAKARRQQAEIAYVQAVQGAFRDVHDALVAHRGARETFVAQDERRARVAETLKLAERRYRAGYSSYLEVLDAERNLFSADRERLVALRNRQTALISVYRALGGGWTAQAFAASAQ